MPTMTAVPAQPPVLVSVLAGGREVASFALAWANEVERGVLVTAVAVVALDLGADAVAATRPGAGDGVAVVTGHGVAGPAGLADLLEPLRPLLPPNEGFRPLAAEVLAARRNLEPAAVPAR